MRKNQILRGRTSFERVFRTGSRIDGKLLRFHLLLQAGQEPAVRVGFAVPARVLPSVWRNRVRRLMRAAFRAEQPPLEEQLRQAQSCLEGVLVYRPKQKHEVRTLGLQEVRDDLARIVRLVCERL